jgi:hypothetical protein
MAKVQKQTAAQAAAGGKTVTPAPERTTEELLKDFRHMDSVEEFTSAHAADLVVPSPADYLIKTAAAHGVTKKVLTHECLLERSHAAHLLGGTKKMTRDKLLIFALVGKLTVEETQVLLKYGQVGPLYIRDKRDKLLLFALQEHKTLEETQELLLQLGVQQLSTAPNTRDDK